MTERVAKPLLPFLNVPLASARVEALARAGFEEIGVNLHHLAGDVERRLRSDAPETARLAFFPEPRILGTAGALRNAADWLGADDFLLVNSDAVLEPDWPGLVETHRRTGRPATLLLTGNPSPDRFTPIAVDSDRITRFGRPAERPLLYTGVAVLSGRLLARIPPGEASLVADLWNPMLREDPDSIGWSRHDGPFADLGRPSDFLAATLEALERGGPFPGGSGEFDARTRVLARRPPDSLRVERSVLGASSVHPAARVSESAVWDGAVIEAGASLQRCLAAGGRVAAAMEFEDALLWSTEPDGPADAYPLAPEPVERPRP